MQTAPEVLFLGEAGRRVGLAAWQMAALFRRGFLPPPRKIGRYRVLSEGDLPAVAAAARRAGYLPAETAEAGQAGTGDGAQPPAEGPARTR